MRHTLLFVMIASILNLGCSKHVLITSDPPGAELHVDGLLRGKTPQTLALPSHTFAQTSIRLSKEGYHDVAATLRATQVNGGLVVAGVVLLFLTVVGGVVILVFWAWEYEDVYHFVLQARS